MDCQERELQRHRTISTFLSFFGILRSFAWILPDGGCDSEGGCKKKEIHQQIPKSWKNHYSWRIQGKPITTGELKDNFFCSRHDLDFIILFNQIDFPAKSNWKDTHQSKMYLKNSLDPEFSACSGDGKVLKYVSHILHRPCLVLGAWCI